MAYGIKSFTEIAGDNLYIRMEFKGIRDRLKNGD